MTCYSDGSVKNDEATIGWVIQAAWATDGLGYPIWHEVAWALAQLGTETVVMSEFTALSQVVLAALSLLEKRTLLFDERGLVQ